MKEIKVGKNLKMDKWEFVVERPAIDMGENYDGSHTKLLPWVEVEPGVQVHVDRVAEYKERRKKITPQ